MSGQPIALPPKAKARVQQSIDNIEEIQKATGAYLEGVAASLDVPDGYTFDQNAMAFVPPPTATVQAPPPEIEDSGPDLSEEEIRAMLASAPAELAPLSENGVQPVG